MSFTWDFAYLVPHASFPHPIETEFLAFVPPEDERLKDLANKHVAIMRLTKHFSDQFGRRIKPSAILIRSDAPKSVDFYPVVCFRNVIAMSSIIDAWTIKLAGGNAGYPLWSDFFDFFPFTATRTGDELIAKSVASVELNKPDKFRGQRGAHIPSNDQVSFGIDEYVLQACLKSWNKRFIKKRLEWKTRKLFRSLEVACQASRMPALGTRQPTIHDVGIGIALWVSSFEIISHPRTAQASRATVLNLLGEVEWQTSQLKAKRYTLKNRCGRVLRDNTGRPQKFNFIQKLYAELYRARNDFLHGNPVRTGSLFPSSIAHSPMLLHCAPIIYRAALTSFLEIKPNKTPESDLQATFLEMLTYSSWKSEFEKALRTCQRKTAR